MKKKQKTKIVEIELQSILHSAIDEIVETNGGINHNDVKYLGENLKLRFEIPDNEEEKLCNELCYPDEEGGCGDTGGACICGKPKNHEDDHKCKLCGHEW